MRALNANQRAFVFAWFMHGGNASKAAASAGYQAKNLAVAGHEVFHHPKVQEAISEYAQTVVKTEQLVLALTAVTDLLKDPAIDPGVRAKLALAIYDRTGLHAKTEHKVSVEHSDNRQEMVKRLIQLAREQGRNPRELVGNLADVTDADFEELPALPSPAGREGLEDLL